MQLEFPGLVSNGGICGKDVKIPDAILGFVKNSLAHVQISSTGLAFEPCTISSGDDAVQRYGTPKPAKIRLTILTTPSPRTKPDVRAVIVISSDLRYFMHRMLISERRRVVHSNSNGGATGNEGLPFANGRGVMIS